MISRLAVAPSIQAIALATLVLTTACGTGWIGRAGTFELVPGDSSGAYGTDETQAADPTTPLGDPANPPTDEVPHHAPHGSFSTAIDYGTSRTINDFIAVCGNNGSDYAGELVFFRITASQSENASLTLTWQEATTDLDFFLYDHEQSAVAGGFNRIPGGPENAVALIDQAATYYIMAACWVGVANTPFTITLE